MSQATYTVTLDRLFHGPMDLLLHLVREQEVEIHEIEIALVVEGFLGYLGAQADLDIEVAGDFVVMAATLMSIKARSLLPREEIDLQAELDPRDELIQRLIDYRRFHEAAARLAGLLDLRGRVYARSSAGDESAGIEPAEFDLGDLTAWDLLAQYSRLLRETQTNRPHRVVADTRPLRFYVDDLARRVREHGEIGLRDLLAGLAPEKSRESLVGSFCALLELVKLGLVTVEQSAPRGEIRIRIRAEHAGDLESVLSASRFDDEMPEESPAAAANADPAPVEAAIAAPTTPTAPTTIDPSAPERAASSAAAMDLA